MANKKKMPFEARENNKNLEQKGDQKMGKNNKNTRLDIPHTIIGLKDEFMDWIKKVFDSEEESHRMIIEEYKHEIDDLREGIYNEDLDYEERQDLKAEKEQNKEKLQEEIDKHRSFSEKVIGCIAGVFIAAIMGLIAWLDSLGSNSNHDDTKKGE